MFRSLYVLPENTSWMAHKTSSIRNNGLKVLINLTIVLSHILNNCDIEKKNGWWACSVNNLVYYKFLFV